MPRSRRGGPRVGTQGERYPVRSDLRDNARPANALPIKAPSGGPYGSVKELEDMQRAVPMGASPGPPTGAVAAAPPAPIPGAVPFDRPTEFPDEPVTAGLRTGPGPGPEALGVPSPDDSVLGELRAIYQQYPHPDILDLILFEEDRR